MEVVEVFTGMYESLSAEQRKSADRQIEEWLFSSHGGKSALALAMVRRFRITSAAPALEYRLHGLNSTYDPRGRFTATLLRDVLGTLHETKSSRGKPSESATATDAFTKVATNVELTEWFGRRNAIAGFSEGAKHATFAPAIADTDTDAGPSQIKCVQLMRCLTRLADSAAEPITSTLVIPLRPSSRLQELPPRSFPSVSELDRDGLPELWVRMAIGGAGWLPFLEFVAPLEWSLCIDDAVSIPGKYVVNKFKGSDDPQDGGHVYTRLLVFESFPR